jgi:predicted nucleic acid-binding protein
VFIAFIKGEKTQGPNHDQDAKAIFDSIIDAARGGAFKIITSGLTIAEVFKNKKNPEMGLTLQENEDLRPYFREDYIQIVEVDRDVGDRANELCRTLPADPSTSARALRPNDAIHIASAERAECDVVLAWDPDFISQKARISTIRLETPERVVIAVAMEQSILFKNGAPIEPEQKLLAAAPAEALQTAEPTPPIGPAPTGNEAEAITDNTLAVRGDDSERAPSEAGVEANEPEATKAADKVKGPNGVQSHPTP